MSGAKPISEEPRLAREAFAGQRPDRRESMFGRNHGEFLFDAGETTRILLDRWNKLEEWRERRFFRL